MRNGFEHPVHEDVTGFDKIFAETQSRWILVFTRWSDKGVRFISIG